MPAALLGISLVCAAILLVGSMMYYSHLQAHTRELQIALGEANDAQTATARQLEVSRRSLFALTLNMVAASYRDSNARALALLEDPTRCPEDLRDFTWQMFHRLCQPERVTISGQQWAGPGPIAVSPDGHTLAAALGADLGGDTQLYIMLWDLFKGTERAMLRGPIGYPLWIGYTPDGRSLALASTGAEISRWDPTLAKPLKSWWIAGAHAVAFSHDGQLAFIRSEADVARYSLTDPPRRVMRPKGLADQRPASMSLSGDGKRLAVGCKSVQKQNPSRVLLLDATSGQLLASLPIRESAPEDIFRSFGPEVAISPDGRTVAVASPDGTLIWDPDSGRQRALPGGNYFHYSVVYCPDGRRLAASSLDGVRLWDAATGQVLATFAQSQPISLAFTPDGTRLISISRTRREIKVWDVFTELDRDLLRDSGLPTWAALAPDSRTLLAVTAVNGDFRVMRWDTVTRQGGLLAPPPIIPPKIPCACAGQIVAMYSEEELVVIQDAITGAKKGEIHTNRGVTELALSANGSTLATWDQGGCFMIWEVGNLWPRTTFTRGGPEEGPVWCLALTPDGKILAAGLAGPGEAGEVRLWDAVSGQAAGRFSTPGGVARCLAFSPDGQTLAAGYDSGAIQLWDFATGLERLTIREHQDQVNSLAFSPDGKTLATGSSDKTIGLWDPVTGVARAILRQHSDMVTSVAFSADGMKLVTASHDGVVKLWEATPLHEDFGR
jgi:WD40 repeat protein